VIAYVDSSVFLRRVLGQPDTLEEWPLLSRALTSRLADVECARVLDRLRLQGELSDDEHVTRTGALRDLLEGVERVELNTTILRRAAEPLPVPLKALDALHLTTALALGYHLDTPPVMATHDRGLARASRALGLRVIGV
jgi:predicted nucleic acid-binding protein